MDKSVGPGGNPESKTSNERGVVDFADARVRLRTRTRPSNESLLAELDEIHSLLDQGLSTEAKDRLALVIASARNHPTALALARCALATALEQQGHYRDTRVRRDPAARPVGRRTAPGTRAAAWLPSRGRPARGSRSRTFPIGARSASASITCWAIRSSSARRAR